MGINKLDNPACLFHGKKHTHIRGIFPTKAYIYVCTRKPTSDRTKGGHGAFEILSLEVRGTHVGSLWRGRQTGDPDRKQTCFRDRAVRLIYAQIFEKCFSKLGLSVAKLKGWLFIRGGLKV